jgi:hypothetical protein
MQTVMQERHKLFCIEHMQQMEATREGEKFLLSAAYDRVSQIELSREMQMVMKERKLQTVMQERQQLFYMEYMQQIEACREGDKVFWSRAYDRVSQLPSNRLRTGLLHIETQVGDLLCQPRNARVHPGQFFLRCLPSRGAPRHLESFPTAVSCGVLGAEADVLNKTVGFV